MKGQTEAELQMYPLVLGTGSRVPRQQKADMLNSAVLRSREGTRGPDGKKPGLVQITGEKRF